MIFDKRLKTHDEMDNITECSERSIKAINSRNSCSCAIKVPPNGRGRPQSITLLMLEAVCEDLAADDASLLPISSA
jgi:hypothetical protein